MEDEQGLSFWPEQLVASLTPAYPDRVRVVTADGSVGYRPLPMPEGSWVPVGESRVRPGLLLPCGEGWMDPAEFEHPGAVAEVEPEYQPEPFWALRRVEGEWRWLDGGEVVEFEEACRGLVRCASDCYFRPSRLRRISGNGDGLMLIFDEGQQWRVTPKYMPGVLEQLGLSELSLFPTGLTRQFLREFPFEIARAPAEVLQRFFKTARALMANLIWQALFFRRLGLDKGYGTSHRAFWYNPVYATLERAGLVELPESYKFLTKPAVENMYFSMLMDMIDEDRLFSFRDLGFEDSGRNEREIGAVRPEVILLIEKDSLRSVGLETAGHFGLSWIVTGGISHLLRAEYFCEALRAVHGGTVRVLVYGDFDPGGWSVGRAFVQHLLRYGVKCPAGPEFLVLPQVFTQEELDLFGRALSEKDGRVDDWVVASGGIGGLARGIHADWLKPGERVRQAVAERLAAVPR